MFSTKISIPEKKYVKEEITFGYRKFEVAYSSENV